jgi:hypothetical protein
LVVEAGKDGVEIGHVRRQLRAVLDPRVDRQQIILAVDLDAVARIEQHRDPRVGRAAQEVADQAGQAGAIEIDAGRDLEAHRLEVLCDRSRVVRRIGERAGGPVGAVSDHERDPAVTTRVCARRRRRCGVMGRVQHRKPRACDLVIAVRARVEIGRASADARFYDSAGRDVQRGLEIALCAVDVAFGLMRKTARGRSADEVRIERERAVIGGHGARQIVPEPVDHFFGVIRMAPGAALTGLRGPASMGRIVVRRSFAWRRRSMSRRRPPRDREIRSNRARPVRRH